MEDEELLGHEIESKQQREERKRAVWSALEQQGIIPGREELTHFSNLLQADIDRAEELWSHLGTEVRREFVQMLSEVADDEVVMDFTAIFRIALRDTDPDVRAIAVEGFHEVEDPRLVPAFIDLLHHDPALPVRRAAARALADYVLLGELGKIRPVPFEAAVQALCEHYSDEAEDFEVRCNAVEALAYTGEHNVPELIASAYAHDQEAMRQSAVVAMGRSADQRWGPIVRRELHNPSPSMRLEATRAAGELQLRAAVREVIDLAEDADAQVRAAALWSLGQIGGNLARKALQRYINAEDAVLSQVAEEALQELEFFYGDLSSFFGPPSEYDGETEEHWRLPGLGDLPDEEDELLVAGTEDEDDDDDELYATGDEDLDDEDDPDNEDDDLLDTLTLIEALDDDEDEDEEDWG